MFQVEGRFERYEAPTIPVEVIEQLNKIQPELGTDIARLTIDEAKHRRRLENRDLDRTHRANTRAQWLAWTFTMSTLGVAAYAIMQGQEVAGTIVGLGGIGSVLVAGLKRR